MLPPEVLEKIFAQCNLGELVNIVDVCQQWRHVAIRQYNASVTNLVLRNRNDINNLIRLLSKRVRFTKLHVLWGIPIDVDCGVVSLDALANATSLSNLQSFMLTVKDKGGEFFNGSMFIHALLMLLSQTSADTLTHVKLLNTGYFPHISLEAVLKSCQRLSHLVLNACDLNHAHRQICVDIIPTLSHLELLDLRYPMGVEYFDLSFVAAIKTGCLNISNNIMINRLLVSPLDDVSMLHFVSHVDTLAINGSSTEQLKSLVGCWNEIASEVKVNLLYINSCERHITNDILLSLVQGLRGLKSLNVSGCHQLTNKGVVNVIISSPELEGISLFLTENIDIGIIQLLDRVARTKNMLIDARQTNLSEQMVDNPEYKLYTGKSKNICVIYRG